MPPGFFISYTQADAPYVKLLAEHLRNHELPVWLDAQLEWGARFTVEIRDRLATTPGIIVIMSPASERSEWVEREVLEGQRWGRYFLPILLRGNRHFLLATSGYFDARDGRLLGEPEINRLRALLEAGGGAAPAERMAKPDGRIVPVTSVPAEVSLQKLSHALEEGQLAHADILTTSLLLQAAQRLDKGWLRRSDGVRLPAALLADIDIAWSKFSHGQQGFAAQLALHATPPPGAPPGRYRDFLQLALSVGWKGLRGEVSPVYAELVGTGEFVPGFFPTMRNPQLERFGSWHDKWTETVMAVHTRLRQCGVRG
jgi:hypothetical protein